MIRCLYIINFISAVPNIIYLDPGTSSIYFELGGSSNELYTGYCKPLILINDATFEISIKSKTTGKYYISKEKLIKDSETHFSFILNCMDTVMFEAILINNSGEHMTIPINDGQVKLEVEIEKQINSFNETIAKEEILGPAIAALNNIEKLLVEIVNKLQHKETYLMRNRYQDQTYVKSIVLISCITICLMIIGNIWQTASLRVFFKQKKLL